MRFDFFGNGGLFLSYFRNMVRPALQCAVEGAEAAFARARVQATVTRELFMDVHALFLRSQSSGHTAFLELGLAIK